MLRRDAHHCGSSRLSVRNRISRQPTRGFRAATTIRPAWKGMTHTTTTVAATLTTPKTSRAVEYTSIRCSWVTTATAIR